MAKFTKNAANLVIFCDFILLFGIVGIYLRYKFEAIHNKDYSVVKTLKAAGTRCSVVFLLWELKNKPRKVYG